MSQRDVVFCSVLQRILVEIKHANFTTSNQQESQCVAVCCSVLQYVAVCCKIAAWARRDCTRFQITSHTCLKETKFPSGKIYVGQS